jgi:hypothetical protein
LGWTTQDPSNPGEGFVYGVVLSDGQDSFVVLYASGELYNFTYVGEVVKGNLKIAQSGCFI